MERQDRFSTTSPEAWRRMFLNEIASAAELLEADAIPADKLRRLPDDSLRWLKQSKLRLMKYPAVLGGAELHFSLQFEVIEKLAYHNSAAAWCFFNYADLIGRMGAFLGDTGVEHLFGTDIPLICGGGGGVITGPLFRTEGGYLLDGRWIYASGLYGSDWVVTLGKLDNPDGSETIMQCVIPRGSLITHDNWHVLGMRGSGSVDFEAKSVFVPFDLATDLAQPARRGGALYQLSMPGYCAPNLPAVCIGLARRTLDEAAKIAVAKMRGYSNRVPLAQRGVFQSFLGEAEVKLAAVRALVLERCDCLIRGAETEPALNPRNEIAARAAGAHAVRVAGEIVPEVVRHIGGDAIREGSRIEQAYRDIEVAATHFIVNDVVFETHAQYIMGIEASA